MLVDYHYKSFDLPPLSSFTSHDESSNNNNNNTNKKIEKTRFDFLTPLPVPSNSQFALPLLFESGEGVLDPIKEGLRYMRMSRKVRGGEEMERVVDEGDGRLDEEEVVLEDQGVIQKGDVSVPIGRISTWDSPSPGVIKTQYTTAFLTESSSSIWEAEASQLPHSATLAASTPHLRSTIVEDLLKLSMGFESDIFAWDREADCFDWRREVNGKGKGKGREREEIVGGRIWGTSIESSESLIRPFLTLGTYVVRLQAIVNLFTDSTSSSSSQFSKPSFASHAVGRALSTYLFWVRSQIANLKPNSFSSSLTNNISSIPTPTLGILALLTHLSSLLQSLTSLATLFNRQINFQPPYISISLSTPSLLSLLYDNLQFHLAHSLTPPLMDQILSAWLLNGALKGWWHSWEKWLGITSSSSNGEGIKGYGDEKILGNEWMSCIGVEMRVIEKVEKNFFKDGREEEVEPTFEYILHASALPTFFPLSFAVELFEAGKSLRLLRKSKPSHPVCQPQIIEGSGKGLIWRDGEIDRYQDAVQARILLLRSQIAAWRSSPVSNSIQLPRGLSRPLNTFSYGATSTPENLQSFLDLMDRIPGTESVEVPISLHPIVTKEEGYFLEFFNSFLSSTQSYSHTILPPTIPSLEILLNVSLFSPLRTFARLPSTSLLTLFFTDLSLQSHFSILHSYFLLGSYSFSSKLKSALFSPPEEKQGYTIRRRRRRDQLIFGDDEGELSLERETWGVGLGISLSGKEKLGYGGAILSLTLRTTLDESIVEELEGRKRKSGRTKREKERKSIEMKVFKEVEENLSFALKVVEPGIVPVWADQHSLAALNFLYLDYKSSSPLDLLLTPEVLSKYNEIFSHLLKLSRIESVSRSIWSDISKPNTRTTLTGRSVESPTNTNTYLLDSDPQARKELLALAFEIRGLVANIVGFSFDSVVEGNYNAFKKALGKIEKDCIDRERRKKDSTNINTTSSNTSTTGISIESIDYNTDFEDDGESQYSLQSVFTLHQTFLDRVKQGLFLRQRQAPLLNLIESGIFGIILELGRKTKMWRRLEGTEEWKGEEVRDSINEMQRRLRAQAVILVNVLTALEERGGTNNKKKKRGTTNTTAPPPPVIPKELDLSAERGGGESYIQELLVRLDANKFYSGKEERR